MQQRPLSPSTRTSSRIKDLHLGRRENRRHAIAQACLLSLETFPHFTIELTEAALAFGKQCLEPLTLILGEVRLTRESIDDPFGHKTRWSKSQSYSRS